MKPDLESLEKLFSILNIIDGLDMSFKATGLNDILTFNDIGEIYNELKQVYIEEYTELFSQKDIDELIVFYSSSLGQKVLSLSSGDSFKTMSGKIANIISDKLKEKNKERKLKALEKLNE